MAEAKTKATKASVNSFLAAVKNTKRRADAREVLALMQEVTGVKPVMWGPSIVGFGVHQYVLANGKPGEMCRIGFSPRSQALVFYLGNFPDRAKLLDKLGKHRLSPGCLYIKSLADVEHKVLKTIIKKAWAHRKTD